MKIHDVDRKILKHSGDPEWLEKHGKKAMEEYLALYPEKHRRRAEIIFARSMFNGKKSGLVFGAAPHWWRKPHSGPPNNDPFRAILGGIATGRSRTPGKVYTEVDSVGSLKPTDASSEDGDK